MSEGLQLKKAILKILQLFLGKVKVKAILFLAFSNIFPKIVGFIMPFILIRLQSSEFYGKFTFVLNTLVTISTIFTIGFSNGLSRFWVYGSNGKEQRTYRDEVFAKSLLLTIVVSIAALFFVLTGHNYIPGFNGFQKELLIGWFYIVFTLYSSICIGIMYAQKNYKEISLVTMISAIVQIALLIEFTVFFGLSGTILSYVISSLLQIILISKWVKNLAFGAIMFRIRRYFYRPKSDFQIIKKYFFPVIISSLSPIIALWFANQHTVRILGFKELGFVSIAFQLQTIMNYLPSLYNSMEVSELSKVYLSERTKYIPLLANLAKKTALTSGTFLILILIFSYSILRIYSEDYSEYYFELRVFACTFFLNILINVLGQVILSAASMWWGALFNFIWALSFIVFILSLLPGLQVSGYAYAYLFSYLTQLVTVGLFSIVFLSRIKNN